MSEWTSLDNLGSGGMAPDQTNGRAPNILDLAVNVRPVGAALAGAGGYAALSPLPQQFTTLFRGRNPTARINILAGAGHIYEWDGAAWTDRTGSAVSDGQPEQRWSGGWLTGVVILANQSKVRTFAPGLDSASTPMGYDATAGTTWEGLGYTARVMRPFREYAFVGVPTISGTAFNTRVMWSAAVEPGQRPTDWIARETNDAGDVDLADTPGSIVDMVPLRDSLLVYKTDAIYSCQWAGGNQVFTFRRLTTGKGIYSRDSVVEYAGKHWCIGLEDIFVTDGNTVQSLAWGKAKEWWLNDRDPLKARNNFAAADTLAGEVLFFYASKAASTNWPDKALVLNMETNAFFVRDYGQAIRHAHETLKLGTADTSQVWFLGLTSGTVYDLEGYPTRDGAAIPAFLERTHMFGEPGHDWVQVDQTKLLLSGASGTFKLGTHVAPGAAVEWKPIVAVNPAVDYKTDARANGYQLAYRLDVSATTFWQLKAINLLVQKSGDRK